MFSKHKIETSFHNAELSAKIMVSRALGATRIPTLNTVLTGTHLPGEQSKPHFARRQYRTAEFNAPLNPTDKFTSCPKHTTLLGIQTTVSAVSCITNNSYLSFPPPSLLLSLSFLLILCLTHTHTHTHTHTLTQKIYTTFYLSKATFESPLNSPHRTQEVTTQPVSSHKCTTIFSSKRNCSCHCSFPEFFLSFFF